MPDSYMTIIGNLVEDPTFRMTKNGHAVTNFRVASTPRRFDREQEAWVDGQPLYITVSCWRGFAENVVESFSKGQPVVVYGRYCCRKYEVNEQVKYSYELEAVAVGHDLSRGVSRFTKVSRGPATVTSVPAGPDGTPADDSDHWYPDATTPGENDDQREADEPVAPELAPV